MELLGYHQPTSLEQAKELLAELENAKVLAGGTDLMIEMNKRGKVPEHIVDIGRIPELKEITEDKGHISIGSAVTFTQLKESKLIAHHFHSLYESAKHMGSPQIRNMATVGGNIVNAGSAADIIPCVMAHDGVLVLESRGKTRRVSCVDYFKDLGKEKADPTELLVKILLPVSDGLSGFYKLGKRNSLAIARLNAAVSITLDGDTVQSLSVALGAVGKHPFRVQRLESYVKEKKLAELTGEDTLKILEEEVAESIKGRKTMPFKKEAVKGVYKEAVRIALAQHNE